MDMILALYDNVAHAQQVAERLVALGIEPQRVRLITREVHEVYTALEAVKREDAELNEISAGLELSEGNAGSVNFAALDQGGGMVAVEIGNELRGKALETVQQFGLIDLFAVRENEGQETLEQVAPDNESDEVWINVEASFARHFQATYAPKGHQYETYEPGYHFGYSLATSAPMIGQDWDEIVAQAKQEWETRHLGEWSQFAAAIQHGWRVGHGRDVAEDADLMEIQTTKRGAEYRELHEDQTHSSGEASAE